jgi:hypothetical protein
MNPLRKEKETLENLYIKEQYLQELLSFATEASMEAGSHHIHRHRHVNSQCIMHVHI